MFARESAADVLGGTDFRTPTRNPVKYFLIACLLGNFSSIHAGTTQTATVPAPPPPAEDTWNFGMSSYGWITAVEGDITAGSLHAPIDISIGDTLDSIDTLDMTFMGTFIAQRGPWSLALDLMYTKTSSDSPVESDTYSSISFDQKQWQISPMIGYRVLEAERIHLDLFTGARIMILDPEVRAYRLDGGVDRAGHERDWIDPLVGFRAVIDLSEKLSLNLYGDVGGFGVNADHLWQVYAGLGYRVNERYSAIIGYRALSSDYSQDNLRLDTTTHGPVIGVEMRF